MGNRTISQYFLPIYTTTNLLYAFDTQNRTEPKKTKAKASNTQKDEKHLNNSTSKNFLSCLRTANSLRLFFVCLEFTMSSIVRKFNQCN